MRVELRDSLENLFPDSSPGDGSGTAGRVAVGRGGIAAVHVLAAGLQAGERVTLRISGRGLPVADAQWFRLVDVPVEENTGMEGFTESTHWDDGTQAGANPHVIRKAPFRVFDAMAPVSARPRATAGTMALRLQVPVPPDARPGVHRLRVSVQAGSERADLAWDIEVFRAAIPPAGVASLGYTNWFHYDLIGSRHGLEPWSPAYWAMLRKYVRLMAHGRQNTAIIPLGEVFEAPAGKPPVLRRERLERLIRLFQEEGIPFIEGGHLALADPAAPQWKAERLSLGLDRAVYATSPEGYQHLVHLCRPLQDVIERLGLQGRWLQHLSDEPNALLAQDYRLLAGWVRKLMPGVRIIDALMDASFAGAVDIWCPTVKNFQKLRDDLERHRACGDQLWVYTCCVPGGPWINRLLDQELLRPVLLGWGLVRFDLHGYLHWGLNVYHTRHPGLPFEQSTIKEGNLTFPAGDTHIVYPGADGPWSSLRFEAHREGFEDAELLRQLKAAAPRRAAAIIGSVLEDFRTYTHSIPALRAARRRLLASLS